MCVIQIFVKGSRELLSYELIGNIVLLFLQIWEITEYKYAATAYKGWSCKLGSRCGIQLLTVRIRFATNVTYIHTFINTQIYTIFTVENTISILQNSNS
jgi:hypothetical protein